jgi:hypothetical protein
LVEKSDMDQKELFARAAGIGRQKAEDAIAARQDARRRREHALEQARQRLSLQPRIVGAGPLTEAHAASAGFLVAAGDSWFDYPFHNILTILHDDYGYNFESTAHNGDPMEAIAYLGGQIDGLSRMFEKVIAEGAVPKAVLLSGGGDDIAGKEFGMLLNNKDSVAGGWNPDVLKGVIEDRIAAAYVAMLNGIDTLSNQFAQRVLPIIVHGYDYPVPDGRGFLGGFGPLPGPWLQPGFREKNFEDLQGTISLMHEAIDRFNTMLIELVALPQFANHVHYIDLRYTLRTDSTYKDWWANELHPTEKGFEAVTAKFADLLGTL